MHASNECRHSKSDPGTAIILLRGQHTAPFQYTIYHLHSSSFTSITAVYLAVGIVFKILTLVILDFSQGSSRPLFIWAPSRSAHFLLSSQPAVFELRLILRRSGRFVNISSFAAIANEDYCASG